MVSLHFSSYSISAPPFPSFPLPSCFSERKVTLGTRPKRHPRVRYTHERLYRRIPTDAAPEYYQNVGFSHCDETERRQSRRKRQKESDSFLETWSQDFWRCVLRLHDIMRRFSLSAFSGCRATETCAKKWKIKKKTQPSPGLETIRKRADVIV